MLYKEKQKYKDIKNLEDKLWNKSSVDELNKKTGLAGDQVADAQDKGERISPNSEHEVNL